MHRSRFNGFEAFDKLEDFINDFVPQFERRRDTSGWTPRVDVRETQSAFVLDFELPGVKKDEIGISLNNGRLHISGERRKHGETMEGGYSRGERRFGRFSRTFDLPDSVDPERIEASMEAGVLTLTLPKKEDPVAEQGRRININ